MSEKHEGRAADARPSLPHPDSASIVTVEADIAAAEALSAWPDRLAEMLAAREARKAATKAFRAAHERRRQYAHPRRHAAKQAHR